MVSQPSRLSCTNLALVFLLVSSVFCTGQSQKWVEVKLSGAPSAREFHTAVINNATGKMWTFGGYNNINSSRYFNDLWSLNVWKAICAEWANISVSGGQPLRPSQPSARSAHTAVLGADGKMWIFGGSDGNSYFNDLWYISVQEETNPTWVRMTPLGTLPSERRLHTAVLAAGGKMWIFGGYGNSGLNDLWYISVQEAANPTWVRVTPSGPLPSPRSAHTAVLGADGKMWIFGGYGNSYLNDLWYISVQEAANPTWVRVTPSGPLPPGRRSHIAVLAADGKMWIFGGRDGSYFNDLWYISVQEETNPTWVRVTPSGPLPPGRYAHIAVLAADGKMWIFGGYYYGGSYFNDLWYISVQEEGAEVVDTLLPLLMGTHIIAAVGVFVWWYRWQPAKGEAAGSAGRTFGWIFGKRSPMETE